MSSYLSFPSPRAQSPPPIRPYVPSLANTPIAFSLITGFEERQDNTKNGFLQLDDRVLVYRGADQPDMSVINPESDVWQHIKVRRPFF